jgi:hypothetical protein
VEIRVNSWLINNTQNKTAVHHKAAAVRSRNIHDIRPIRPETAGSLVELGGQHLAAQALVVALAGSSQLAFTFSGGLFVKFAGTQFGQETGFLYRALEAAQGYIKRLVFLDTYAGHLLNLYIQFPETAKYNRFPEIIEIPVQMVFFGCRGDQQGVDNT